MGSLAEMGVFDIILPFILIFTIVFAVLQKTKILGEQSKNFNMVIALVMGMSVVVPHVLWGTSDPTSPYLSSGFVDIVKVINNSLPQVSVILVAILMVLLIFGIWGSRVKLGSNSLSGIIAFLAFFSVAYIFGGSAGWWEYPTWLDILSDPDTVALIVTILVFAIIIWFITKEDNKEGKKEDAFGKFFGSILESNKEK